MKFKKGEIYLDKHGRFLVFEREEKVSKRDFLGNKFYFSNEVGNSSYISKYSLNDFKIKKISQKTIKEYLSCWIKNAIVEVIEDKYFKLKTEEISRI